MELYYRLFALKVFCNISPLDIFHIPRWKFWLVNKKMKCIGSCSIATDISRLQSVQDFFIKLDMKPCMHLV